MKLRPLADRVVIKSVEAVETVSYTHLRGGRKNDAEKGVLGRISQKLLLKKEGIDSIIKMSESIMKVLRHIKIY